MANAEFKIRTFFKFLNPYFTAKTYVVGTQKNRLCETILLSIHDIDLNEQ